MRRGSPRVFVAAGAGGGLRSEPPRVEKAPGLPVGDATKLVRPALAGPRLLAHVLRCVARHVGFGAPRVSRASGSGCVGTLVRGGLGVLTYVGNLAIPDLSVTGRPRGGLRERVVACLVLPRGPPPTRESRK